MFTCLWEFVQVGAAFLGQCHFSSGQEWAIVRSYIRGILFLHVSSFLALMPLARFISMHSQSSMINVTVFRVPSSWNTGWKGSFPLEVVCTHFHVCGYVGLCSCTILSCKWVHRTRATCCTCIRRLVVSRNMFCSELHLNALQVHSRFSSSFLLLTFFYCFLLLFCLATRSVNGKM